MTLRQIVAVSTGMAVSAVELTEPRPDVTPAGRPALGLRRGTLGTVDRLKGHAGPWDTHG